MYNFEDVNSYLKIGYYYGIPSMDKDKMVLLKLSFPIVLLSVDLDPHFMVRAPNLNLPLCFNFDSPSGSFVSLIRDPQSGEHLKV